MYLNGTWIWLILICEKKPDPVVINILKFLKASPLKTVAWVEAENVDEWS